MSTGKSKKKFFSEPIYHETYGFVVFTFINVQVNNIETVIQELK